MLQTDEIGFGGLKLMQSEDAFRYGIDAVILADFASRGNASCEKIIDLGTGNAIIPLILSHKIPGSHITGIEVQTAQADLAQKNVSLNCLEDRISIICSDVLDIDTGRMGKFGLVTCNPPYVKKGAGIMSGNIAKMTARHETTAGLGDFLRVSSGLIDKDGEAVFVHRPHRLTEIFQRATECGLSPAEMRMVFPYPGTNANIVLVRFKKGRNKELTVLPELHVRTKEGAYSDEILRIYEKNTKKQQIIEKNS